MDIKSTGRKIWEFCKTFSDYILLAAGEGIAQFIGSRTPYGQLFSVLDPTISFPKAAHEKVSGVMLYVYSFAVPLGVVLLVNLSFGPGNIARRLKLLNGSVLGVFASVIVAQIFTELIKFIVGRPRPDFLSRCEIDTQRAQAAFTSTAVALFNSTICTTTDKGELDDGFRSFPSGHSSMSFAGLTFLSLWLAGRLQLFVPHSVHGKHIYSYMVSAAPLLLASFVTSSRVSDYRHRGTDVLGGASLGVFWAIVGYRYYYPWINSSAAGIPWTVVIEENEKSRPSSIAPLLPTALANTRSAPNTLRGVNTPYSDVPTAYEHVTDPMGLHPLPAQVQKTSY